MAARNRSFFLALLLISALFSTGPVAAQVGHPLVNPVRPLHERLEAADLVVRSRVARIEMGRIVLEDAVALVGAVAPRFEIKRSPLSPPPLSVGDETILFLAGARAPYVLRDEPVEVIRLVEPSQATRWTSAIRELAAASGDPGRQIDIYLSWVDEGPATLRALGGEGASKLLGRHKELIPDVAGARVAAALNPGADSEARIFSARIAGATAPSVRALCRGLARSRDPLDPQITELALRGGGVAGGPEIGELLDRAIRDADPEVRMAVARALNGVARTDRARAMAAARFLAESDPEEAVRRQGERIVRNLQRPSGPVH